MESVQEVTSSQTFFPNIPYFTPLVLDPNLDVCNSGGKRDSARSVAKICDDVPGCDISNSCAMECEAVKSEVSSKYYAVSFPGSLASLIDKENPLIFQSKRDALQAIKQHPKAQFREFNSRTAAVKYASVPLFSMIVVSSVKGTGEKTQFRKLPSEKMVQFRKAIESGNEAMFLKKVWRNPRYLINKGGGPTVIDEGLRYNALHIALQFKQTSMCLTILSVIHDKLFISTMYPEDKPAMIEERTKHLVDQYLNMPDKSFSRTPVHFACKFGVDTILAILLSCPECDITKLDKYGSSPKEVICDSHDCDSDDHKKIMHSMFEETVKSGACSKYYAVSFPPSLATLIDKENPLIFQSKRDALQAIKQHPEARFQEFHCKTEAVLYAQSASVKGTGEKTQLKKITSEKMVQFSKAIESGNDALFLKMVWRNPCYLINKGGGPTVIYERQRYNALHIALRFKQTSMCLTILSVIHDKLFISAMYPKDKPSMIEERTKHLVYQYLNMPEKSFSRTPVHFACEFGVDTILAILLSCQECDITKLDKYGKTPKEVICNSHDCDSDDHSKIVHFMFEETVKSNACSKYYAVSFPPPLATSIDKENPLIFESKSDALQAIKQHPKARFKEFHCKTEAVLYAQSASVKETREKGGLKKITSEEMDQFWEAIESGNEALFLEKVWGNPHYLINNGGGPTIINEEHRYNALHAAVRFKQTGMFLTILSLLHDKLFISTRYPKDKPSIIEQQTKHLVYLYLNMPDKSRSATPVNLACFFGVDSILAILLSYPECDITKLDKFGSSPKEVICEFHKCHSRDHKKRMRAMFEDIFYVPIMRDDVQSFVGQPCHANAVLAATSYPNKKESGLTCCAFAGPMSESAATKFCTILKKKRFTKNADLQKVPFSPEEKTLLQICLSDSKKGLERVGRKFTKDFATGWFEFWKPLDCWLDLSSEFGLDYLNSHLKRQEKMINPEKSHFPPLFSELITSFTDDLVQKLPVIMSNMSRTTFFLLFQTLVHHMCCFTKFSFSKEKEITLIHEEIGHLLYLKLKTDNKNNFNALKFYLNIQFHVVGSMQAPKWKMFLCILKFACYFQSNAAFVKVPVCDCEYVTGRDYYDYSSQSCYLSVLSLRQHFKDDLSYKSVHPVPSVSGVYNVFKKLKCMYESYQDPKVRENIIKSALSVEEEDEKFFAPPESHSNVRNVFVNGQELSDDDIDIFRAIVDVGVQVNKNEYPSVFKWKCLMESILRPVLKLDDKISCTPTSSSAAVRRAVTHQRDSLKRALF